MPLAMEVNEQPRGGQATSWRKGVEEETVSGDK